MNKKAILEGLLFVVGEDGLTIETIQNVLELNDEEAKILIMDLKKSYEAEDRGLRIDFLGNKFKLTTKVEHREYYQKLLESPETNTLSQAALETLAIIAYNEPITRIRIDEIRGVATKPMIRKLVAKGLIKEAGKSNLPGRPILYKTTNEFLDYFNIENLNDLPKIDEYVTSNDEIDLYDSRYKEDIIWYRSIEIKKTI